MRYANNTSMSICPDVHLDHPHTDLFEDADHAMSVLRHHLSACLISPEKMSDYFTQPGLDRDL